MNRGKGWAGMKSLAHHLGLADPKSLSGMGKKYKYEFNGKSLEKISEWHSSIKKGLGQTNPEFSGEEIDQDHSTIIKKKAVAELLKKQEDAKLAVLKRKEIEGDLVDLHTVVAIWSQRVSMSKAQLLSLPVKAAEQIAVISKPSEKIIENIIANLIDEVLKDLANTPIPD